MTASNFPACLTITLQYEGGWADDKNDPGGATQEGITQAVYDAWRRSQKRPIQSVRGITQAEVATIYRLQYWDAVRGDELFAGLDLAVWDYGVNSGPVTAIKALQRALGVTADGAFGLHTMDATTVLSAAGRMALIQKVCDERLSFWEQLRTWRYFGAGWRARGAGINKSALAMFRAQGG